MRQQCLCPKKQNTVLSPSKELKYKKWNNIFIKEINRNSGTEKESRTIRTQWMDLIAG